MEEEEENEGRMNLSLNSVESVLAQIQGLSNSAEDISQLHAFLKQSEELLLSESISLAPLLAQLHPSEHSLGYLYILLAPFYTSIQPRASLSLF